MKNNKNGMLSITNEVKYIKFQNGQFSERMMSITRIDFLDL